MLFQNAVAVTLLAFIPLTVFSALFLILSLVKMNKIKKQYGMEEIRRNEAIYRAYADRRDGAAVWTVALTSLLLGAALAFALLFGLGDGGALLFLGLLFALLIAVPAFFAASLWIFLLSAGDAKRLPFEICQKRSRTAKTVFIVSAVLLGLDAAFCIGFPILLNIWLKNWLSGAEPALVSMGSRFVMARIRV